MAAVDYFLKLKGIDGESTDHKHKGEIDVESFSWGETNSGTHTGGGGGGAGKVVMQDFHFVMKISKASPKLMLACATGEHLGDGTLVCRKAGTEQQEFLSIKMTDLLVSSYQTGGSGHGDVVPTDQVSLRLLQDRIRVQRAEPDGSLGGAVKAGYDLKANKKV